MLAVLLVFAIFATATGVRLGYWQVVAADETLAQKPPSALATATERSVRADIVDRNGTALATTVSYDSLDAHPDIIDPEDVPVIMETLDAVLRLGAAEREEWVAALSDEDSLYVQLRTRLTFGESEAIAAAIESDGSLRGLTLTPVPTRRYTVKGGQVGGRHETTLAAPIVGYVSGDGSGAAGIERYYDEQLTTADPGSLDLASIAGVPGSLADYDPPELQLTIDAGLQKQVEKELIYIRKANTAKSVSALVMDPYTGAILAAATVPGYNANEYAAEFNQDPDGLRNRLFQDQYEPGSVMKIFTVTAALEAKKVTPNTRIADQAVLRYSRTDKVRNSDHLSRGMRTVKDHIARSRNVVAAKLAKLLAPHDTQRAVRRLYDLWRRVGLTEPTGAGVAGEADGELHDPAKRVWMPIDLGNASFGQGIAVTLPQLARGVSTIVNGGRLVQPHLVADSDAARVQPVRVLDSKYARQAKEILAYVTGSVPWYAEGSLIPGFEIGGKTGTGQIWNVRKNEWKEDRFNHSFVGYVGGRKQEYVIAVRLEESVPISTKQGLIDLDVESYEAFRKVASATIKHLGMKASKDPNAGRPIIGTDAARALDPVRNSEAQRASQQEAKQQERREARAAKAAKAGSGDPSSEDTDAPGGNDSDESGSP
jgi:cell division protein FtsI (penicillin-binding protein 3)